MRETRVLLAIAVALAFCTLASQAVLAGGLDEASDVKTKKGDPHPTAEDSNIDEYTFQDEQINIEGNKDSVVKVLRVNQKNLVNDFVVGIFPIYNAHPKELRSVFRMICYKEGGRAEVIRDKVGKKAYLQVICPRFQLPYIEAALKALDEPWLKEDVDGSKQLYYRAKFRDVRNILDLALIPGEGEGEDVVGSVVDQTSNAVFRRDEPYRVKKWLEAAQLVDVFPPQLTLEAAVYEVELTNDIKLGLDYIAWKCGPGRNLFNFAFWGFESDQWAKNVSASAEFDPFIPGHADILALLGAGTHHLEASGSGYYAATSFLLSAEYMDFLVRKGRARLVTTGRLNVRHGETGNFSLCDEVIHFYREPDDEDLVDYCDEPPTGTCVTTDTVLVGLDLEVTPHIGLQTTQLDYEVEMSDLVGNTPDGIPMVRFNACEGTVLCRSGMPICVGGLKRGESVKSTAKMPILGSLPVLGWLFGGEQNADHQTELVVVLTPQIVQFSEMDKELARPEDKKVRAQAARQMPLTMLKTEYGFDQWLLEKN